MRYWWVNQNQTYEHEISGQYLWSPKRKKDGALNPFYETMREVAPGDLVFSFANTRIMAFGLARSYAYECPKPAEFGAAGRNWAEVGWRVDVTFHALAHAIRPAEWMHLLGPLLPTKYSPLQPNGRGVQSIYLTELTPSFAHVLADLIGTEVSVLARTESVAERALVTPNPELVLWEEHLRRDIEQDPAIDETQRQALIIARRGQGLFRERVQHVESHCRITRVDRPEHLRASHCKPWRDCANAERLDGENGLLLTPSIDHLFDRGFISFRDDGGLLISPVADRPSLVKMGVEVARDCNVGAFTARQRQYLEYHRDAVFLKRHGAA
jgi:hypothetical protein